MNDISSFSIQNARQISKNLLLLVKNKCLLSARFGANNESYITTLLDIDEKNNTVILDYGAKEDLNQRLLNAGKVAFDTEYCGIKVSFTGEALKKVDYKGETAFSMPMPKSLYWMQRREFFRVKPTLSNPCFCHLVLKGRPPVDLKIYDISLSGFAMINTSKDISELLLPGTLVDRSKLVLSDISDEPVTFEISTKCMINLTKTQRVQKISCKFVELSRSAETNIQRYMHLLQRESIQKMAERD
ncbi:MAG: flagellar brake protein [Methylococcaceae bacterium]